MYNLHMYVNYACIFINTVIIVVTSHTWGFYILEAANNKWEALWKVIVSLLNINDQKASFLALIFQKWH